jgi:hypothetical protein
LASRSAHFRAHERLPAARLPVLVLGQRTGFERQGTVVDVSLAGAGLETDEPLVAGERLSITLSTPTMWDPLVIEAVVVWAHPPRLSNEVDAIGRSRTVARAGVVFDYPAPPLVLSMFEMLATLGYE